MKKRNRLKLYLKVIAEKELIGIFFENRKAYFDTVNNIKSLNEAAVISKNVAIQASIVLNQVGHLFSGVK